MLAPRGDQADLRAPARASRARSARRSGSSPPPVKNEALMADVSRFLGDRLRDAVQQSRQGHAPRRHRRARSRACSPHFAAATKAARASTRAKAISDAFDSMLKADVRGGILRRGHPPGWPRPDRDSPDLDRGRLPAAHARLGDLHPRSDPGAHRRHARLDRRRAAARLDQP